MIELESTTFFIDRCLKFIAQNLAPFIAKVDRDGKVKASKDDLELITELDNFLRGKH
jgi:hypothetical protein